MCDPAGETAKTGGEVRIWAGTKQGIKRERLKISKRKPEFRKAKENDDTQENLN